MVNAAVFNQNGTFNNFGDIVIGSVKSPNIYGIENGSTFNNNEGATINIGKNGSYAVWNDFGSTFNNRGLLTVGLIAGGGSGINRAIFTAGAFNNYETGIIQCERSRDNGIKINSGHFRNWGIITIGINFTPKGYGIFSFNKFTNEQGGLIWIASAEDGDLGNGADATMTNNGIISRSTRGPVGGLENNEIIIQPTTTNCSPVTSAFRLGGQVNSNFLGVFSDEETTISAGNYDLSTNTFTDNPELTNGTYSLFVKIEDPVSGIIHSVPWNLTLDDTEAPTFTCPNNITVDMEPTTCQGIVPDFNAVIDDATDNCGNVNFSQDVPANSTFGSSDGDQTTVTITADDGNGNQNDTPCIITLTLNDKEAPTFTCPGDQIINMDLNSCSGTIPDF